MIRLVRAELLKLRTVRSTTTTALAGVGIALLLGAANAAIAGDPGTPSLGSAAFVEDVVGVSAIPAGLGLLLGVLLSAGEHQHGTITTTFLAVPHRGRVVAAKALAAAAAGVALALVMVTASVLASVPALVAAGAAVDALHVDVALAVTGLVAASALLAAAGVLLGLLVRSQVASVVLIGAWALVVEAILDVVTGGAVRDWMPGGAASRLAGNGDLPMGTAALVLLAWIAALAVVTVPTVQRRDVA